MNWRNVFSVIKTITCLATSWRGLRAWALSEDLVSPSISATAFESSFCPTDRSIDSLRHLVEWRGLWTIVQMYPLWSDRHVLITDIDKDQVNHDSFTWKPNAETDDGYLFYLYSKFYISCKWSHHTIKQSRRIRKLQRTTTRQNFHRLCWGTVVCLSSINAPRGHWRLRSDCADVQADPRVCLAAHDLLQVLSST